MKQEIEINMCIIYYYFFSPGGATFPLKHSGRFACGIQDRLSVVMIGGHNYVTGGHNYVTRWVGAKS